MCLSTNL